MSFIVKITTSCGLFDLICPHSCRGCGAIGKPLCKCCKNDIIHAQLDFCPNCKGLVRNGRCENCWLPPIFTVGVRERLLGRIIHDYKYHQVRALGSELADILDRSLPVFGEQVTIVPLPTIRKHIRERGFDHIMLIAKKLAKLRGWKVEPILARANNSVQVGADKDVRQLQAREAYTVAGPINKDTTYLLLDDVWTTGASMKVAIKKLQQAGVLKIAGAVLAVSRLNH